MQGVISLQNSSGQVVYRMTNSLKIAIRSMGLNDIHQFRPEEKIIEFVMAEKAGTD